MVENLEAWSYEVVDKSVAVYVDETYFTILALSTSF
jgi:hypothetical protein